MPALFLYIILQIMGIIPKKTFQNLGKTTKFIRFVQIAYRISQIGGFSLQIVEKLGIIFRM